MGPSSLPVMWNVLSGSKGSVVMCSWLCARDTRKPDHFRPSKMNCLEVNTLANSSISAFYAVSSDIVAQPKDW